MRNAGRPQKRKGKCKPKVDILERRRSQKYHKIMDVFYDDPFLFHDLLLRSYLYHCVWGVITAHNLTPEKRDNNYSPHPLTPPPFVPPEQHSAYKLHLALL